MLFRTLLISACSLLTQATITEFIDLSDKTKFCTELKKGFVEPNTTDLSSSYYATKGYTNLNEPIDNIIKTQTCSHIHKNFNNAINIESIFHAVSTWSILKCNDVLSKKDQLYGADTIKKLKSKLENQDSTVQEIRYALETLQVVGEAFPNPTNIAQLLQKKLKSDDSLSTSGHALHAAALLGTAGKFALQYFEDILVQADEVEGRILQWEGGLSITGLLLTGMFRLSPVQPPLTQTQADKFANYLLTRTTVRTPKGVSTLTETLLAISRSKVSPISVTFVKSSQVQEDKPDIKIRIADLFGKPLLVPPTSVVAQSGTRVADDVVVISKQALATSSKDKSEYVLTLKQQPGQYRIVLAIGSEQSATVLVQVLGSISLQWLEAGLGDSDGSTAPHLTKLQYPAKLSTVLNADASQHLLVRFALTPTVHQAFLRLSSEDREIIFVAEQDANKIYKVDINLSTKLIYSGTLQLELILGDSLISNPIQWHFGSIKVNLPTTLPGKGTIRGLLPEIVHQFRPAEKRPPQTVSTLFTALAAAPLLLLFVLWLKIGFNFSNFTFDALPFHIGLGSIFGLFGMFWLKLDMFTTCGWLIPIGGFTFLTGHHILSKLARKKK